MITQPTIERTLKAAMLHNLCAEAYEAFTFTAPTADQRDEWDVHIDEIVNQLADGLLCHEDVADALIAMVGEDF